MSTFVTHASRRFLTGKNLFVCLVGEGVWQLPERRCAWSGLRCLDLSQAGFEVQALAVGDVDAGDFPVLFS